VPISRDKAWWEDRATDALTALLATKGAVLRAEAEALLSESSWVHDNVTREIPPDRGPNPHHITTAYRRLRNADPPLLIEDPVELNGRVVTAWLDGTALADYGAATTVRRIAAGKRRRYRTFLGWTGNNKLCGDVAEAITFASIAAHTGTRLLLPPNIKSGRVTSIAGHQVTVGGPLDAAGYWLADPDDPMAGLLPFAVEVKNVRSWLYPWDHETWDLLAKVAGMDNVIPVLVARKVHPVTFRCFSDIGALAHQTGFQWFTSLGSVRHSIDRDTFRRTTLEFGFSDARLITDMNLPEPRLTRFFGETAYKPLGTTTLAMRAAARWQTTSQLANEYTNLREEELPLNERGQLWGRFCDDIRNAGLYERGEWAPEDFNA
jgi:hypothetical protein